MTTAEEQIAGFADRVTDLIERGQVSAAVMMLAGLHPADQADVVLELDADDQRRLVEALAPPQLAAVLEYLESEDRSELVEDLTPGQLAPALDLMEDDDAAVLLQDMEP